MPALPAPAGPGPARPLRGVTAAAARATMVVMVLGVAAGCGGSATTLSQQVRTWAQSTGWAATAQQLQGDLRRLAGLNKDSVGARRTVCDVLVTDALSANQQLPTPDRAFTALLSAAYSSAADAGRRCYAGSVAVGATPPGAAAAASLVRAQARYDSLTSTLPGAS